jgi:hypothetical protein
LSPPNGAHAHHPSHRQPSQSRSPRRPSPQTRMPNTPSTMSASTAVAGSGPGSTTRGSAKFKKKPIELPDLNLNSLSTITPPGPRRVSSQTPSQPIPIPSSSAAPANSSNGPSEGQAQRQTANTQAISDADLGAGPSSLVVPPPPPLAPTRLSSNASFGRKEKKIPKRQKAPYSERTVRSMLYSGVPTAHDGIVNVLAPVAAPNVQVQLLYPGQADSVSVSGTYETSWDIRTDLQYE